MSYAIKSTPNLDVPNDEMEEEEPLEEQELQQIRRLS